MTITKGPDIHDVRSIEVPSVSSGALIAALLVLNNRVPGSIDYIVRLAALINAGYDVCVVSDCPSATKRIVEEYYAHLYLIDEHLKEGKL